MHKVAVFDIGTNSLKMFLCELDEGGTVQSCEKFKSIVRLGQNLYQSSTLDPKAYERGMKAFSEFHQEMKKFSPQIVRAVGTSALRTATDAHVFISEVNDRFGIDIEVISGDQEASYISGGIICNEPAAAEPCVLLDIGGGSTEVSVCSDKSVLAAASLKLGAARGQQDYLHEVPPSPDAVKALKQYLIDRLNEHFSEFKNGFDLRAIGSSGSIRALMRIFYEGDRTLRPLTIENVVSLRKRMASMKLNQLRKLPGLEPERAPVILSAALVLEGCMKYFGCTELIPTDFALKDGILAEIQSELVN